MKNGNRTIKVKKADLLTRIRENRANHIKEFAEAVVAYKKEAIAQLEEQLKAVNAGGLSVKLNLVSPKDNTENYDKIIKMFQWELEDVVELTQDEFKEYVLDESSDSMHAKILNSTYLR